jgi:hypothetical protein
MKKIIALAAAVLMVAGYAYAGSQWNFYGNARISTFKVDKTIPNKSDTDNYEQALQSNSRIGATVKASDTITGGFEYGTGVNVRKLYGEWNFGAGSLLVGQTYTPLNPFYSNQVYNVDEGLADYGGIYSGREPMLRLKFGGFQVALLAPKTDTTYTDSDGNEKDALGGNTYATNTYTVDTDIPGIEARYTYSRNNFTVDFLAGYQTYDIKKSNSASISIDSYVLGLGGTINIGQFYVAGDVFTGQNVGLMISMDTGAANGGGLPVINAAGNDTNDNNAVGYLVVVGAKINDMFSVEFGYGTTQTDFDESAGNPDDDVTSYYAQATITLAPGVFIVPEIGTIDYEESNQNEIDYIGAKWQINF